MDKFCKYIYAKDSTDRLRTRAILCHIYHHAIHDNWFEARDLMLMSHLQDSISHSDPPTQILYNRTMVQLGLCGFRHAEIKDAHNALLDIQLGGRSKELLAQGLLPQVISYAFLVRKLFLLSVYDDKADGHEYAWLTKPASHIALITLNQSNYNVLINLYRIFL